MKSRQDAVASARREDGDGHDREHGDRHGRDVLIPRDVHRRDARDGRANRYRRVVPDTPAESISAGRPSEWSFCPSADRGTTRLAPVRRPITLSHPTASETSCNCDHSPQSFMRAVCRGGPRSANSLLNWDYRIQWPCPSQALRLTRRVKVGHAGIMMLTWPGEVGVSGYMKDQGS